MKRVEQWVESNYRTLMIAFMVLEGVALLYLCVLDTLVYLKK